MLCTMLKAKIHRARVTEADRDYVGSISIDSDLMLAAGLLANEQVHVLDITNGARLVTYAIPAPPGSTTIGINGAAAHLVHPGDLVIIASYVLLDEAEARGWRPTVVHLDARNRPVAAHGAVEQSGDATGRAAGTGGFEADEGGVQQVVGLSGPAAE